MITDDEAVAAFFLLPIEERTKQRCMEHLRLLGTTLTVFTEGCILWDNIAMPHLHAELKIQCKLEGLLQ